MTFTIPSWLLWFAAGFISCMLCGVLVGVVGARRRKKKKVEDAVITEASLPTK